MVRTVRTAERVCTIGAMPTMPVWTTPAYWAGAVALPRCTCPTINPRGLQSSEGNLRGWRSQVDRGALVGTYGIRRRRNRRVRPQKLHTSGSWSHIIYCKPAFRIGTRRGETAHIRLLFTRNSVQSRRFALAHGVLSYAHRRS